MFLQSLFESFPGTYIAPTQVDSEDHSFFGLGFGHDGVVKRNFLELRINCLQFSLMLRGAIAGLQLEQILVHGRRVDGVLIEDKLRSQDKVSRVPGMLGTLKIFFGFFQAGTVMPRDKFVKAKAVDAREFVAMFDPTQILIGEPGFLSDKDKNFFVGAHVLGPGADGGFEAVDVLNQVIAPENGHGTPGILFGQDSHEVSNGRSHVTHFGFADNVGGRDFGKL